jgi:hypothetical protein
VTLRDFRATLYNFFAADGDIEAVGIAIESVLNPGEDAAREISEMVPGVTGASGEVPQGSE